MLTFIDKYPTSASVIFYQVTTTSFTEPVYQPYLKKTASGIETQKKKFHIFTS